jgi:hypothetical protein
MRILKRLLIAVVAFGGFLAFMTIPIMVLGFVSMSIWGPELMDRSLGPDHPSTLFFLLTVPPSIVVSGVVYIAMVILPVFAKYDIPIGLGKGRGIFSMIGRTARRLAIRYAELLEKY